MKTLLIAIIAFVSFIATTTQDKTTVKAVFDGLENEVYYFSEDADTTYVFDAIGEDASKKIDLTNEKYIGQNFRITYTTESLTDEMDNEMEVLTIVDLEILEK